MSDQPETLEVRMDRVTPWWLFVFLAAVAITLGLLAWQVRGLGADVRAMHAQQPEAIAPVAATPAEAAPTPAPARPRASAPRHAPAQPVWGTTDLDRAIAAYPSPITHLEQTQ